MAGAAAVGCTFGAVSPVRAMYSGIGVGVLGSPWLKNDSLPMFQSLVSLPANCSRHRLPCRSPMQMSVISPWMPYKALKLIKPVGVLLASMEFIGSDTLK